MSSNLYLRQVLIGPMANYVYLIGDPETRETMVVDPAWDVQGILDILDKDDMKLTGALVTHYHPDHIGGDLMGHSIPGIPDLLEKRPVKIYMHKEEAPYVKTTLGLESSDFVAVDGETTVQVGNVPVRMIHTPGHTPGSLCFLVDGNLVSGDTLFIGACGRVDLPGASPEDLYYSLTQKLKKLPDETVLYPGHNYASDNTSTIGREKDSNVFMRFESVDDFLRMMGFPS
jgi:glyoxylase-like metal-dependent hydrolase (beta-lactamase superfamily II)